MGLWIKLFVLTLLVTSLATGAVFMVFLPLLRRRRAIDADAIERFMFLGLQHRTLGRKVFAYGDVHGVRVVASWSGTQLMLHAKVQGTAMLRIHATTYPQPNMYGVHQVGSLYVAQGHESHVKDETAILEAISKETTTLLTDKNQFPEGVALRSGYFTFLYGGAAALILAGGDEELALSADLQMTMPFYVSDDQVEKAMNDLAEAATMLTKDLA